MAQPTMPQTNVMVFGTTGVGKTSLVMACAYGPRWTDYDDYTEDTFHMTEKVPIMGVDQQVRFTITEGAEYYSAMREMLVRSGDAFLIALPAVPHPSSGLKPWEDAREIIQSILEIKGPLSEINLAFAETKVDLKNTPSVSFNLKGAVPYIWPSIRLVWQCFSYLPVFHDVGALIKQYVLKLLSTQFSYSLVTHALAEEFQSLVFETSAKDNVGLRAPFVHLSTLHHTRVKTPLPFCFPPEYPSLSDNMHPGTLGSLFSDLKSVVDGRTFHLHKTIIACRHPGFLEHFGDKNQFDFPDGPAGLYEALTQWVYTGQLKIQSDWEWSSLWAKTVQQFGCFPLLKYQDFATTEFSSIISFEMIFDQNTYSDVTIKIGKKKIFGHKVILGGRCNGLRSLLENTKDPTKLSLNEDYDHMFHYIKWMYTDQLDQTIVDVKTLRSMMKMVYTKFNSNSMFIKACERRVYIVLFGANGSLHEWPERCRSDLVDTYQWALTEHSGFFFGPLVLYLAHLVNCVSPEERLKIKTQSYGGIPVPPASWVKKQIQPLLLAKKSDNPNPDGPIVPNNKGEKENCIIS